MEKKTGVALGAAIIFTLIAAFVFATIPLNFDFMTVQPTFKTMDSQGNIQTLAMGQLTTVEYPSITKIQVAATVKATLVGLDSTRYKWWINWEASVKSLTSNKMGKYDEFESGNPTLTPAEAWTKDNGWSCSWQDQWFTDSDNTFDTAPWKRSYYLTTSGWASNFNDGWISLDPNTYASLGESIKSGSALSGSGETPSGEYEVKLSLHIKVDYEDNYGKQMTAIGPGKNGEIIDWLVFKVNFTAGTITVTVSPKTSFTWIPLEMSGESPDYVNSIGTAFGSNGLPSWTPHIFFVAVAFVSWLAFVYCYRKEK